MYTPSAFVETDLVKLHDAIERYSFGMLISVDYGVPVGSHLPFLLDRNDGPHGALIGHMAKANEQWQHANGSKVLAVFTGPHAYISPTWYEAANTVPTWNYVAVHVYGKLHLIEGSNELKGLLERTVNQFEQSMPEPWRFEKDSSFIDRLVAQIVGFRIAIERIEGKWKLNQNHPMERREKVIHALERRGDEKALAISEMMRQRTT